MDLQSQAIYVDNFFSRNGMHTLEDGASGVQVGEIEQVFFFNLSKI